MAYQRRTPPIRVIFTIEKYNELLELINNYTDDSDERIKNNAIRLKDKLLRYSVPYEKDNETYIDVRFFINEATEIINMLLVNLSPMTIENNYYEELLKNKEVKKQEE